VPSRFAAGLGIFGAWTALAVFFALSSSLTYISQGRPPIWGLALAFSLAQWWLWAALTPVVFLASRRWPLGRGRLLRHVPIHLVIGLAAAYGKITAEGYVRLWLFNAQPYVVFSNLALQVLIYWALVAGVHALDQYGRSRARAADAEGRLNQAQLQLLRAQLQPHFLFNALNAVSELIHEDPDRADQMIGRLSDLLRATLDAHDRADVTLDEEVDLVRCYLAIQEVRLGDRLVASIDVPPEAGRFHVPYLLLQPLVENAIEHGIGPRASGGVVRLSADVAAGQLTMIVEDDGVGWTPGSREGIGLANTRARLTSLYGRAASFSMAGRPGGGATATIVLPTGPDWPARDNAS
jgi:signal transduction histidine kinase